MPRPAPKRYVLPDLAVASNQQMRRDAQAREIPEVGVGSWVMVNPPDGWQPANTAVPWQKPGARLDGDAFGALRQFFRKTLFGLPPGRMERRDITADAAPGALPDRPLAASVSKRRLITVVKDLALQDPDFAALVTPVLGEFRHSRAKGEWQHCVAALAQIRRAHPALANTINLPLADLADTQ